MSRRKHYRVIPPFIHAKLPQLNQYVTVTAIVNISLQQLVNGTFNHVGLTMLNNQPTIGPGSIPEIDLGRYSKFNVNGQQIIRRDLPKYEKEIKFRVPCFGDYSNMCDITQYRWVYVRENIPARNLSITPDILLTKSDGGCVAKFAVNCTLNKESMDFERDLLFCLNLLYESIEDADLFSNEASVQDYLGSIHVNWEILPAGNREDHLQLILSSFRNPDQELKDRVQERYGFFEALNPKHLIRGNGGMSGYIGAEISDDLVIFENMKDGNALYMLFADWRRHSQLTKTELLSRGLEGVDYIRIIHSEGWEARVHSEVNARRPN